MELDVKSVTENVLCVETERRFLVSLGESGCSACRPVPGTRGSPAQCVTWGGCSLQLKESLREQQVSEGTGQSEGRGVTAPLPESWCPSGGCLDDPHAHFALLTYCQYAE